MRAAFPKVATTWQRWIDTQREPLLPGYQLRVILGGDEKFLRAVLGISCSRFFLSVYSEARWQPRTDTVVQVGPI